MRIPNFSAFILSVCKQNSANMIKASGADLKSTDIDFDQA
jgi:hypothetical protein